MCSRARCVVGVVSVAAVTLVSTEEAYAASRNLELEWTAPAGCPSREEMEDRIAHLVGRGRGARETIRAQALVESDDVSGVVRGDVKLSTADESTSRHVEGDSCAAVSDAFALIIALAIDPDAAMTSSSTAPAPAVEPPRASDDGPRRRPLFGSASACFDVSSLPAATFGAVLALGFNPRHLDLEVDVALLAPARASLDARPDRGADIRLTDLGARACWEVFDAPFDVGPCAGLHARWLSAHGFGSDEPYDALTLFGLASFGARAKARLSSRITLRGSAEAMVPMTRPSFVIENAGTVYQTTKAGFRTAFGVELHF